MITNPCQQPTTQGVLRFTNGKVARFRKADGLPSDRRAKRLALACVIPLGADELPAARSVLPMP